MADFKNPRELRHYESMIQVAKMYYLENLSQQQIADRLGMSRSNVSRILISCKEEGIVEIRIHEAVLRTFEIKRKLVDRFGLLDSIITPCSGETESVLDSVSRVAAGYVQDILADGITIGIGWGSTIHRMVNDLKPGSYYQSQVVQLMGGTSIAEIYKDGVQLALDFARKIGGVPHILNAPLLVSSKAIRDLFIEENSIKLHLEMAEKIDAAIVTVGTNEPDRSTMVAAGYLSQGHSRQLCEEGLFTHILGQHIDMRGEIGDTELNGRVVGIHLNTFRQIPLRIGVACGDYKARQIAAALCGGYINVLVTDERTALQVEQFARENGLGFDNTATVSVN